jgi:hypothetical protein
MKLLSIILSIFLFVSPVKAETYIIPVQDLLYEIPNFAAPEIDLNSIFNNGTINITNPPKTKREIKEYEKKLKEIIMAVCPNVESVKFWKGNAIIKVNNEII